MTGPSVASRMHLCVGMNIVVFCADIPDTPRGRYIANSPHIMERVEHFDDF